MSLRSWFDRVCHLGLSGLLIIVGAIGTQGGDRTSAQVTPDPSVGTKVRTIDDTTLEITGGTTVGNTNLFHSFSNFSVKSKEIVDFHNASNINNILVRVTGRNPSDIQGTLQAQGNANLFLINPNGIIFGGNAQLNILGSFIGTTASAIQFPGGGEFSMTSPVNPLNPLLRVNPSAFLFNQILSQPIKPIQVNEALLFVPESQSLVLLGGDVNLEGAILYAPDGRVELGGLAGVGTVKLNIDNNNFRLSFPDSVARADVSLTNLATVTASGEGGGGIQVQGKRVTLADGSEITVNTLVSKSGGTLVVNASESVELLGGSRLLTGTTNSGTAGELRIETGRLIVQDGSQVSASTFLQSTAQGGALSVTADSIQLIGTSPDNKPSGLFTVTQGTGSAGELKIETGQLIVQDGAQVIASTLTQGGGGKLSVSADSIQLIGSSPQGATSGLFNVTQGSGSAGELKIETGQLIVRDGAQVVAHALGVGNTGSIVIDADVIALDAAKSGVFSTLGSTTAPIIKVIIDDFGLPKVISEPRKQTINPNAQGNSGNIDITSGLLSITNGARLTASTFGRGNAGSINLNTQNAVFSGTDISGLSSGVFSAVEKGAVGNAGTIKITTNELTLKGGGQLVASSFGEGNAGTVTIEASDKFLVNGSNSNGSPTGVFAESRTGRGGDIGLQIKNLLMLRHQGLISATSGVAGSNGVDGNINIGTKFLVAVPSENSDIIATGFGRSPGSNIQVNAQKIFGTQFRQQLTSESDIVATGQVTLNTPDIDPNSGLLELPTIPVVTKITQGCYSAGYAQNRFVISGRGGLPRNPYDLLSPNAVLVDWVTLDPKGENHVSTDVSNQAISPTPAPIVEAQGWVRNAKREIVLTADAPTTTLHSSWQKPANCRSDF
ncbi:two-partner secretion domain-containing protein [Nostoc sp.]|uniref:two-partner secretion domain-containing protein n=1 Tax=Nostoc sp. TaxID=1180 RepID=UPI002FF53E2E